MTPTETSLTTHADSETLYCYVHPNRQTLLRCNRCERPICIHCAIRTETGYRCKECVHGLQKVFDTSLWWDYPLAFIVAGILGYIASLIVSEMSGFLGFITLFVAPIAGMIISSVVRFAVHRRRSKRLVWAATAATLLGSIVVILTAPPFYYIGGSFYLYSLLWPVIFTLLTTSTVYYRLAGIH